MTSEFAQTCVEYITFWIIWLSCAKYFTKIFQATDISGAKCEKTAKYHQKCIFWGIINVKPVIKGTLNHMIIQDNNFLVLQNANQIDGNRIYYCDSRVIE